MKKLLCVLGIILIAGLAITGCTQPAPTTTSAPTQTTTSAPHKVLKIGSVQALTDPSGLEQKKWFDLFAKLINDQGGWKIGSDTYDVDMIIYDSQGDPIKAKSYLEKLVLQDDVKFILGTPTGDPAIDTTVTESNKVICLGTDRAFASADPKIQYYYTPGGFAFSAGLGAEISKDIENKGAKSYVAVKPDNVMGHAIDGWINGTWSVVAPSVKYLSTVFYDPSTVDFGPIATKIMSMNPDVVDCTQAATAALCNSLYDMGFKGIILPGSIDDPSMFTNVLNHCGAKFMEGWEVYLRNPLLVPNQPADIKALLDAYTKQYGEFQFAGVAFVAPWFILKDAIDNTKSVDVEVLKKYLDNSTHAVRILDGYCQLFARPDAKNLRTISGTGGGWVGIVQNGKIVPLREVSLKDHYLYSIVSKHLVDVFKAYWDQYGYPTFPAGQTSLIKYSDLGIQGHD